jgi:hypothetical protein
MSGPKSPTEADPTGRAAGTMGPMVHAPGAPPPSEGIEASPATGDFAITLKGWRSQLRWAMTQREEDPARVWLEVISIDERSKQALAGASSPEHVAELQKFRARLVESIASLTEELGDEKVAPLYSWLDLIRQRRRLVAKITEARATVKQVRALRSPERSATPQTEEEAVAQLAKAQGELAQWKGAMPPEPHAAVLAVWEAEGGDALVDRMTRDPMTVGRRGDEARKMLARVTDHPPGKHPWRGSRKEVISIPIAGGVTLLFAVFATTIGSGPLAILAGVTFSVFAALLGFSLFVRRRGRAEIAAAIDWVWHARMYGERTSVAELEAGWLRALVEAFRAVKSFDARAATGGQLRDFEAERPDLAAIVHEVARDTEPSAS